MTARTRQIRARVSRSLINPQSGTASDDAVYMNTFTHMHVQAIDFRKHPTDGTVAAANQNAKRIEVPEESQA